MPGCFSSLRSLDLSDNSFGGTIPKWLSALGSESAKLSYLNVKGLQLEYPEDKIERQRELQPLVAKCLQLSTKCEGLPPLSCDAFRTSEGDKYKPRTDSEEPKATASSTDSILPTREHERSDTLEAACT